MRRALRILNDWILVKLDPESNVLGCGLIKPDDAYDSIMRTGKVLAVGPGRWAKKDEDWGLNKRVPVGVEVGEGVLFNRFIATKTKTAETLHMQLVLEKDEALIRPSDVLLVFEHEGRPRFE